MSLHDGPGARTVIFFKGCPLRCLWCSTPESQEKRAELALYRHKCDRCGTCIPVCAAKAITIDEETIYIDRARCNACGECVKVCYTEALKLLGKWETVDEAVKEALADKVLFNQSGGGVTFSGGEPMLQPQFLAEVAKVLKDNGVTVGVDTCGHVPLEKLKQVLPYTDFFLWDIKHMDPRSHLKLTGVSNELTLNNARFAAEQRIPLYVRLPLIKACNDSEENVRTTCQFASTLPSLEEVDLLPMHHLGRARYASLDRAYLLPDTPLIEPSTLKKMERIVQSYGLRCRIVG